MFSVERSVAATVASATPDARAQRLDVDRIPHRSAVTTAPICDSPSLSLIDSMNYQIALAKLASRGDLARLSAIGLSTTDALLDTARTPESRKRIADQTGISDDVLVACLAFADLIRVKGVEPREARLLIAAGVRTVEELGSADRETLEANLRRANGRLRLLRRPAISRLLDANEEARGLKPVLSLQAPFDFVGVTAALDKAEGSRQSRLGWGILTFALGIMPVMSAIMILQTYLPLKRAVTDAPTPFDMASAEIRLERFTGGAMIAMVLAAWYAAAGVLTAVVWDRLFRPLLRGPARRWFFHRRPDQEIYLAIRREFSLEQGNKWERRATWVFVAMGGGVLALTLTGRLGAPLSGSPFDVLVLGSGASAVLLMVVPWLRRFRRLRIKTDEEWRASGGISDGAPVTPLHSYFC